MAKMYTLDSKLLIGTPEIRIGDTIIPVDDREKTVKKVMKIINKKENSQGNIDMVDEVLKTVLSPSDFKKLDEMNMPFAAYQELMTIVMSALTGEVSESDTPSVEQGE